MTTTLSIHEAAERLGLHYMTVYRYIRTGSLPARKDRGSWVIDVDDLGSTLRGLRERSPGRRGAPSRREHVNGLAGRLTSGDEPGAWSVVDAAMVSGAEPGDVYMDLFVPALRLVGDRWERGEIGIAEEHRATAVMHRLIGRLGPRFRRRGRSRGVIVLGAPEGELHALPTAIVADLLRGEGFDVVDLGPSVPAESFLACVRTFAPVLAVGVAVTRSGRLAAVRRLVRALNVAEPGLQIIVGGAGVTASEVASMGARPWPQDGRALALTFSRELTSTGRVQANPNG